MVSRVPASSGLYAPKEALVCASGGSADWSGRARTAMVSRVRPPVVVRTEGSTCVRLRKFSRLVRTSSNSSGVPGPASSGCTHRRKHLYAPQEVQLTGVDALETAMVSRVRPPRLQWLYAPKERSTCTHLSTSTSGSSADWSGRARTAMVSRVRLPVVVRTERNMPHVCA